MLGGGKEEDTSKHYNTLIIKN